MHQVNTAQNKAVGIKLGKKTWLKKKKKTFSNQNQCQLTAVTCLFLSMKRPCALCQVKRCSPEGGGGGWVTSHPRSRRAGINSPRLQRHTLDGHFAFLSFQAASTMNRVRSVDLSRHTHDGPEGCASPPPELLLITATVHCCWPPRSRQRRVLQVGSFSFGIATPLK